MSTPIRNCEGNGFGSIEGSKIFKRLFRKEGTNVYIGLDSLPFESQDIEALVIRLQSLSNNPTARTCINSISDLISYGHVGIFEYVGLKKGVLHEQYITFLIVPSFVYALLIVRPLAISLLSPIYKCSPCPLLFP